jgi:endoglucanase
MQSSVLSRNPRWYGFNVLTYFSTNPFWKQYFPDIDDGQMPEDDFRWIRDWGFNFVRLPMDYRFWTDENDPFKFDEEPIEKLDRVIRLGEQYGVHVSLNLHRAPGYCVLDGSPGDLGRFPEKRDLLTDQAALDAFCHQWTFFADRYKGISSERLSFDLVNEPKATEQRRAGYIRVVRQAVAAIRDRDPDRLIVSDGLSYGNEPVPEIADLGVVQSCRGYRPHELTHHRCEWMPGHEAVPSWPLRNEQGQVVYSKANMEQHFSQWNELALQGVPIHCGETGCVRRTPNDIMLHWFSDLLDTLNTFSIGWALWGFRGPSGLLDSGRPDAKMEDWHGHSLNRQLLDLLQRKQAEAA